MSIVSCNVIGTTSTSMEVNGLRRYEVAYRVITNNVQDQSITVLTANGIPTPRTYYNVGVTFDTGSYPKRYSAVLQDQTGDRKTWLVTVSFESSIGGNNAGDQQTPPDTANGFFEYPWEQKARVSGSGVEIQTNSSVSYKDPDDFDSTGPDSFEFIVNAVDDELPQLDNVEVYGANPTVIIEKDFENWPTDLEKYANTVNDREFFGQPKNRYRMSYPRWTKLWTGDGKRYYNIILEFYYDAKGWNDQVVGNTGWRCLADYSATVPTQAKDVNGDNVASPVWLTTDGYQLPYNGQANFIHYNPYRYANFGALGIPTSRTDETY